MSALDGFAHCRTLINLGMSETHFIQNHWTKWNLSYALHFK
jgi:hypothetical protein